jgi:hypothetical protein
VYFDNILVYNKTFDDHVKHFRVVFETLRDSKLYGKLIKCYFCNESVVFLGLLSLVGELRLMRRKLRQFGTSQNLLYC